MWMTFLVLSWIVSSKELKEVRVEQFVNLKQKKYCEGVCLEISSIISLCFKLVHLLARG